MSTATFIIPVYNGEKLIAKTIDSILSQTVLPEQIIIVDDCSTDRTIFILEEYKKQHPKLITIIKHKENLGRSMACNSALDIVKTDYCLMIDADDIAEPNRLEKQVQFMDQNKDVCASSSFVKYINSKGDIFGKGKLDVFLQFNERNVLDEFGKISHKVAESFALSEFEKYRIIQDKLFESDFDKFMIEMENENIND